MAIDFDYPGGPRATLDPPGDPPLWRRKLYSIVPALDSLRTYSPTAFRRDLVAGATVAAVAVPQAMAYASIFGMPVQYGLYTAIVMTAVGALLDSSKQLINGPTNAISIAMLSALAVVPTDQRIAAAVLMAALIGIIQTGITLLRLGDLSRYISHAVIVGFTAGASVLLVLDQLKNVLGIPAAGDHHDHFVKRFWLTMSSGAPVHGPTMAVACGTIGVALGLRWINRRFRLALPELLLAIVAAATCVWNWNLAERGVKLIDRVPRELPRFAVPEWDWSLVQLLAPSALAVGMLGLLEAIAMAKSIAAKTRQKLDVNQQCLSEGLANLSGSFFQCFPGSGSLTRSYINHQAGAATQWSGVFCAGLVALTVLALAPLAQYIPKAALAGVLMVTATRMVDVAGVRYHCRATRFDAVIVFATALSAVLVSVEFCILVGTVLSFLMYVPRAARIEVEELVIAEGRMIRERRPDDPRTGALRVYNFEGEMFFGSAPDFETHLEAIEAELGDDCRVVVLRVKHLRNPDAVCMHLLSEFVDRVSERGAIVCLSGVRDGFFTTLAKVGIVDKLGAERVFREVPQVWTSTTAAIEWAHAQLQGADDDLRGGADGPPTTGQWHFVI
ncbi:MAG TPA: SulP family inorganic anion transporter [Lacipirellulaceae bacterium]|nr:SulP family inorganic anion transporter [Lacipirellulaceae bacterium]